MRLSKIHFSAAVARRARHTSAAATRALEAMEPRLLMSTYTVNTTGDAANPGTGLLTLRQAVADANAHAGADTVAFSNSAFPAGSAHTITLTGGPIAFTDTTGATTVTGPGSAVLSVSGNSAGRVFTTAAKTIVSISGVTVTGGQQTAADADANTYGGGIYSAGTLSLNAAAVTGNAVVGSAYVSGDDENGTPGRAAGGGIYAAGPLTLINTVVTGNTVDNTATSFDALGGTSAGGGVYAAASLTVTGGTLSNNAARGNAGYDPADQQDGNGGAAAGGGAYAAGTLAVTGTAVTGNAAVGGDPAGDGTQTGGGAFGGGLFGGGGVSVAGSTVTGNAAAAGDSGESDGTSGIAQGGGVYAGGAATVTGSALSTDTATGGNEEPEGFTGELSQGDPAPSAGGGLYAAAAATLSADTFDGDAVTGGPASFSRPVTAAGGGAYVVGTLALSRSTLSGDSATGGGNNYATEAGNGGGGAGGGLGVLGKSTITGSTLDDDAAAGGAGYAESVDRFAGGTAYGGGVYAPSSAVTIVNSTVVDDTATGGTGSTDDETSSGNGGAATAGGVYAGGGLTLADSTVTGNATVGGPPGTVTESGSLPGATGAAGEGGVVAAGSTAAVVTNSVLIDNTADGGEGDFSGPLSATSGYDFVGNATGFVNGTRGDHVGTVDVKLSALGDNGGPTRTEVPLAGSPLVDAGSTALVPAGVTTDQRGDPRVVGKAVDVGATESAAAPATTGTITGFVYNDANADGTDNTGEGGLNGFTVYADVNHDGKLDAGDVSAVTTGNGDFTLAGLPPGTYAIDVVFVSGYRNTTPTSYTATAVAGATSSGPRFGQTQGALISGTVFDDANGDGKQDDGETGQAGVRVFLDEAGTGLYRSSDPSVVTTGSGVWSFGTLAPGTYTVRVLGLPGDDTTTPVSGTYTFSVGHGSTRVGNPFGVELTSG